VCTVANFAAHLLLRSNREACSQKNATRDALHVDHDADGEQWVLAGIPFRDKFIE
jgi:hypothetical protein